MSCDTWRRRSPSTLYFASMKSRSRTISSSDRSRTRVAGAIRAAATVSCASDGPIPKMYVSPTSTRLSRGRSTPAIRAISLPLTLLVPWVRADHHDPATTPDHLALLTHLADDRTHLHDGPPVGEQPGLVGPDVHHWLDRDDQARLEGQALAVRPIVRDRRVLVERPADAVPDVFTDDAEPGALRRGLHRSSDIADPIARSRFGDPGLERPLRRLDQLQGLGRHLADGNRHGRVAVVPLDDGPTVQLHEVAFLERAL